MPAMEFGPGLYTTPHFDVSVTYAQNAGGTLVFNKPNLKQLTVHKPAEEEWRQLVKTNICLDTKDRLHVSAQKADVIIGPMSENYRAIEGGKAAPISMRNAAKTAKTAKTAKGSDTAKEQWLFSSHDGIKLLAQNLVGVIYIE